VDQTRREYNKKILDRIASDPTFREELLDDPKGAMERAGFAWEGGDDVAGFALFSSGGPLPPIPNPGGNTVSSISGCAPVGGGISGIGTAVCDPTLEDIKKGPSPTPYTDPNPPVNS